MTILKGETLKLVPYKEGGILFRHPAFKGGYQDAAEEIDKRKLKRPSPSEVAALVHEAFQHPGETCNSEVLNAMRYHWIWEYAGNLYLPKSNSGKEIHNGVIIEINPKIKNGWIVMDKNSLIERLHKNDPLVKFVPFGYPIYSQSPKKLAKNSYIIARYGEEGAEKISEISSKYEHFPEVLSFESTTEERTRVSALGEIGVGRGLAIYGEMGVLPGGRTFGIVTD